MQDPNDHVSRIYAGVLGKLIGVYLGRPFENWTYERIMEELGPINYYVHDRLGEPLVVTDDDVAGTFTFPRGLEDYGVSADLSSEDIGRAWMNYIIEDRSILWWGGAGNSTEHTAWLNLAKGIPAPKSGAIATNGKACAEQIGAQIFIDGWALVSPGNPAQAAKLARAAASVSHDGESVNAAVLWAAMEAEAFNNCDVDHLLDIGLSFIPNDCEISRLIADVRKWVSGNEDWEQTRQRIQEKYGYDKYPGHCHVVPNHGLMIMALLHAPDDFQRGQMIVNTSGWDTDCNAGNLGCLHGIMLGLEGIDAGPDWRGPVADRMLVSSADGGSAITDAVQISTWLMNLARQLAGLDPLPAPKEGAAFHFSLPGSVQGFRVIDGEDGGGSLRVSGTGDALALDIEHLASGEEVLTLTPVFALPEVANMRTYELMACPRVYPGQTLTAQLIADDEFSGKIEAQIRLRHYNGSDELVPLDSPVPIILTPGRMTELSWTIPDLGGQPVAEIGIVLRCPEGHAKGRVLLDRMSWYGTPNLVLKRPEEGGDFWRRAWVNTAHLFSKNFAQDFRISQDHGEGMILHGTRDWTDYAVEADLIFHLGGRGGLIVRAQGQRKYYAARITREGELQIARQVDENEVVLARAKCPVPFETEFKLRVEVDGPKITAQLGDVTLTTEDSGGIKSGAIGLSVQEGALSATRIQIGPTSGV